MLKKLALLMLVALFVVAPVASVKALGPSDIKNPNELIVATIGGPETVDPAWCYDTASAELIFNVYEPLLFFDGERMDMFLPVLAKDWKIVEIDETSSEGLHWVYRLYFYIDTTKTIKFHSGHTFSVEDVEYSFERWMVQDRDGGPQWMIYEPLTGGYGAADLGNLSVTEDVIRIGKIIDHAIECNPENGTVWLNLVMPYPPILQILSQSWASILSKAWVNEYVIGTLGRPDWSGEWGDYTGWINYHNPMVSPLDDPYPVMSGTGPFMLESYEAEDHWSVVKFDDYWRGWPANWPWPPYYDATKYKQLDSYVTRLTVKIIPTWETRRDLFLAGDVDFCAVPRAYISQVFNQPGIRCMYPLPILACDGIFFTFNVSMDSPYGPIYGPGSNPANWHEDGIVCDFFSDLNVRKAFAYAFDYDTFLQVAYLGEATRPPNAIVEGLPCYNPNDPKYVYNPTLGKQLLEQAWGGKVAQTGFTLTILYNTGNLPRKTAAELLKNEIEKWSTKYHINVQEVPWGTAYLPAMVRSQLPTFIIGWLADYPDCYNFVQPFYHSHGAFAAWQKYNNPQMDAKIEELIRELDQARRYQIAREIAQIVFNDCPSVIIDQATGRHFERDWVVGWYYNQIYPGLYAYNIWKWYYVPAADYTTYPAGGVKIADIDFSGLVETRDVAMACAAFGSYFGPPMHPKWNFRADVNFDRLVDTKDVSFICRQYGKSGPTAPP
jgi:peptide/nickel transport system substrate-binding protein